MKVKRFERTAMSGFGDLELLEHVRDGLLNYSTKFDTTIAPYDIPEELMQLCTNLEPFVTQFNQPSTVHQCGHQRLIEHLL